MTAAVTCPVCKRLVPLDVGGTIAGHREPGEIDYCDGSGTRLARVVACRMRKSHGSHSGCPGIDFPQDFTLYLPLRSTP